MRLISGCLRSTPVSWLPVLMWLHLHFATKQQAARCFRSFKPIQTDLFMLMCLNIYLLGLLPDAQYDQTWHLSTQLRSGERTGCRLLCQLHHCKWPYYPAAWFRSPSSVTVLLNRFRTGQGPCRAILHKWGLAKSQTCDCGQQQTMSHIVDACPMTRFDGGLQLLHEAEDDAVKWLESIATTAFAKWKWLHILSTLGQWQLYSVHRYVHFFAPYKDSYSLTLTRHVKGKSLLWVLYGFSGLVHSIFNRDKLFTPDNVPNILLYRSSSYVTIYRSYKLPYILTYKPSRV